MSRVVVVGAGAGGLAAAVRLAAAGHEVTVCEQAGTVGGKLGRFERDGFVFDTGPSLLTLPDLLRELFAATGDPLEKVLTLRPVDPVCHYLFADGARLDVPDASPAGVAAAWDELIGPGAGADWTAFLERAQRIWEVSRGPFLESPLAGARSGIGLLREGGPGALRAVAPWKSLRALGREYLRHPYQRTFLDRYATYSGSDPRRAPAALACVPYVEQAYGAWYVEGGLRRIADALADRAEELGVRIRTGARVTHVDLVAGRAAGVQLADGGRLGADAVVANADAEHLYRDLVAGPGARRGLHRLRRATPSSAGFVLLLALRGRTPGLRHHTVLFPADYDAEFDALGDGRVVQDPTVYISAPDDGQLRPDDDHEAWFVLVNAPRHDPSGRAGVDWTDPGRVSAYRERVLDVMAARGSDVRDRLLWAEVRTPADLERDTAAVGGSIYGTSSNGASSAFLRPANRSPVPGLFLVGGSAHPGGGLPLVQLSARIVADLIGPP